MSTIPLKRLASVVPGQSPPGDVVMPLTDGFPFVQGNAEFTTFSPRPVNQCAAPPKIAEPGDLLISVRAPVGALNWVDARLGIGRGVAAIRAHLGVDARFVRYGIVAQMAELQSVSTGSTYLAVTADQIEGLSMPSVSIAEQHRIADFLDDQASRIDSIIAARRQQMTALKVKLNTDLQGLVDRDSAAYGQVRLRYAIVGIEQGWSPQADSRPAEAGEWGVVRSGCVNGGTFRPEDNKALPADLAVRSEYELNGGDLLLSRASGSLDLIGSVAVVHPDVRRHLILCDKIYRITLDREWSARFVAPVLRSARNRQLIRVGISGAEGMANSLPSSVVKDLVLPRTPFHLQLEVASRLEDLNGTAVARSAALSASIALLTEYKQSLITAAVTGELDVTTASARVPA